MQVLQTCALATSPPVLNQRLLTSLGRLRGIHLVARQTPLPPIIPASTRTKVIDNCSMANEPARTLDYYLVDVFTTAAFAGNPLAVVMNTAQLTAAQMQSIAGEFNLSETTFVERRAASIEEAEGVRVRIFTTEEELPFAGHPTLGTARVLKLTAPATIRDSVLTLAENVGPILVRFPDADSSFAEMAQHDPEFGPELDPVEVARLSGLSVDDLDPSTSPQVVSTGNGFAVVLLRSLEALGRVGVLQSESTAWLRAQGARWFYFLTPAPDENPGSLRTGLGSWNGEDDAKCFRARMQFNGGEDPATGSAAGCAVSYLVRRNLAPSGVQFLIRQGIEMGRPSEIFVSAKALKSRVTDIRVGGSTVLVAKGQLFLP
jgi:trans-2,3-dihydro-3-hydroxyanthranilate isomerase